MIRTICCCLLLAARLFAQTASSSSNPQESKLLVLEHLWNEAQVNRDSAALERLVADRLVAMRCQPHQPGEEVIAHPGKPTGFRRTGKALAPPTKTFIVKVASTAS